MTTIQSQKYSAYGLFVAITGAYLMPSTGLPRMAAQVSVPLGCTLAIVYCGLRLRQPLPAPRSADVERDK